jgi:hypothetical protein
MRMSKRVIAVLGTVVAAVVALTAPATAGSVIKYTPVPANGRVSCYGYYGTFLAGSHVMVVDWLHTSDECFGIATDRTIWHAWVNSGGWHRMGGNGHADDVVAIRQERTDGTKGVMVKVASNGSLWQQDYYPSGWTGVWYKL